MTELNKFKNLQAKEYYKKSQGILIGFKPLKKIPLNIILDTLRNHPKSKLNGKDLNKWSELDYRNFEKL